MRRIAAWLPLYAFLFLIGVLLGTHFGLVRQAIRSATSRGTPAAVGAETPPAPPDSNMVALGRLLFFDPVLSKNRQRACASCHDAQKEFSDGRRVALAVDRGDLRRNAPSLVNVTDHRAFFWDGRAVSLEDQAGGPIHDRRELGGLNNRQIQARLDSIPEYRALFRSAFGSARPRYRDAVFAIAAYEQTLRSHGSTVDRWWSGEGPEPPADVRAGFDLFAGKARCARCHYLPLTTGVVPGKLPLQEFTVIGVPADSTSASLDPDLGRYEVTHLAQDRHAFKAPGLRGVARTAPYMHNGAFSTLAQVVRFYNQGGGRGLGLEVPNQAPEARPIHLTLREEAQLVRFLEALSDDPATIAVAPAHVPSGLPVGGDY